MEINADFNSRAVVKPEDYVWTASPMAGVERMMLDRIGGEVARATTIVRFAPNSEFTPHTHTGGEEFFVLEGVFSDEHRDYPAGTYARNPIGTHHTPQIGPEGATILVKLYQFEEGDQDQKFINTNTASWSPTPVEGVEVMPLHDYEGEQVILVRIAPNIKTAFHEHVNGEEAFILEGVAYDEQGAYPKGAWVRLPHMSHHTPYTKAEGVTLLVKMGHLKPS